MATTPQPIAQADPVAIVAGGGTVQLLYKTLKPREIVCGRHGTPGRTIFRIHASNANTVRQTTGVDSGIMRSPG